LITHFTEKTLSTQGGFNIGGINATGQIPDMLGNYGLVDKDTPQDAFTIKSYMDDSELVLVFSDEFNRDDRSFYPGDDPFWEAVDMHYWGTVSRSLVFLNSTFELNDCKEQFGMVRPHSRYCTSLFCLEV
jgi:hypothetical protein